MNSGINHTVTIDQLIPQRFPIVLISGLIHSDDEKTITYFDIPGTHLFSQNGFLREPGLIENIAQTAAARAGYLQHSENKAPEKGFIGDVSRFNVFRLPRTSTRITTTVKPLQQVFNITLFEGSITDESGLIATCELKIVILNSMQE